MAPKLLIAGGRNDPNLDALHKAASAADVEVVPLRFGPDDCPRFDWDLETGDARLDGQPLDVDAAFLRYDVFNAMQDPRPQVGRRATAWHETVSGWLQANPHVRTFNRALPPEAVNKPFQLTLARRAGLRVPATRLTNDLSTLDAGTASDRVVKPVAGGDYCVTLESALAEAPRCGDLAPAPALVQPRIPAPEIRIYVAGDIALAFELRSDAIDYRVNQNVEVSPCEGLPAEALALRRLMDALGMDFGAADFRTDRETGGLVFLELNTSPMFARFDAESRGVLCEAMVSQLMNERTRASRAGGARWAQDVSTPVSPTQQAPSCARQGAENCAMSTASGPTPEPATPMM